MSNTPKQEIKTIKTKRDCAYNMTVQGSGRQLIYDYVVVINNERRALIKQRFAHQRGFVLAHIDDGREIVKTVHFNHGATGQVAVTFSSTKEFIPGLQQALDDGLIPTLQQISERKAHQKQQEIDKIIKEEQDLVENMNRNRLHAAAEGLYAALKLIAADHSTSAEELRKIARETIQLAEPQLKLAKTEVISKSEATHYHDVMTINSDACAANQYIATMWGEGGRKVIIKVVANSQIEAEGIAKQWGRDSWWKDSREIGIECVTRVA